MTWSENLPMKMDENGACELKRQLDLASKTLIAGCAEHRFWCGAEEELSAVVC